MTIKLKKFDLTEVIWFVYIFILFTFIFVFRNVLSIIYLLPFVFIILEFFQNRKLQLSITRNQFSTLIWYLIFLIISYIVSRLNIYNSDIWHTFFQNILLLFSICFTIDTYEKYMKFLHASALATLCFALVAWLTSPISSYGTLDFGGITLRDRNATAYLVGFTAVIYMFFSLYYKKKKYILASVICIVVTLLTGSRKGIIQLLIPIFIYIVSQSNMKKVLKNLTIIAVIGFLTMLILLNNNIFMATYGQRFFAIFNTSEKTTDMSVYTRNTLRQIGMAAFYKKPIFGYGLGASWELVRRTGYSYVNYFHNNFVEILACCGLVGFSIYHFPFAKTLINAGINRKKSLFNMLMLSMSTIYFVLSYGQVTFYSAHFLIPLFIIIEGNKYIDKNYKQKENAIGDVS